MMVKTLVAVLILASAALIGCGGQEGSQIDGLPNVAGNYRLQRTDCPGLFDDQIVVHQSGENLYIIPTDADKEELSGLINLQGYFTAQNRTLRCEGRAVNSSVIGECILGVQKCAISYFRE